MASLALVAVVTWRLGHAALVDPFTMALALASAIVLFSCTSLWLVACGAIARWVCS